MTQNELHEKIHEISLGRSFFFPSNEIYNNVAGFYDYGPVGSLLKKKVENLFRSLFIRQEGFHEIEASIITPEIVLKASGHVDTFADPVMECVNCKTRVRADSFVEGAVANFKWDSKIESLDKMVLENQLKCPKCKGDFSSVLMFNLMFKTGISADQAAAYCRPETAQGTFTSFQRIFRNHGAKLPIAVAQIGKSFRNEISPRKGIVRMREFTQMELEYFFSPANDKFEKYKQYANLEMRFLVDDKTETKTVQKALDDGTIVNQIMAYFMALEWVYYKRCGIDEDRTYFRVIPKEGTPHYSKKNIDMEVITSVGAIEVNGNAYRTDFDLSQHKKFSGKEIEVFIEEEKAKIIPHVFEAALGVDRLVFCILEHCFKSKQEKKEGEKEAVKEWEWFDFPPEIAPYSCAIFPLMKKNGMSEKAQEICATLRENYDVFYQESGSIGKRYARADEIGVPYAITVDYQTFEDGTVTIRYRNDGLQERIKVTQLTATIKENIAKGRVKL
ncbi:MAG: glycine--tRNA ligase [Candidatus Micrarchaeota archaeon]